MAAADADGRGIGDTLGEYFLTAGADWNGASNWRWRHLCRDRYPEAVWLECEQLARLCEHDEDAAGNRPAIERHLAEIWSLGVDLALSQGQPLHVIYSALLFDLQRAFDRPSHMDILTLISALTAGNDMWRARALALLAAVLPPLWLERADASGDDRVSPENVRAALHLDALSRSEDSQVRKLLEELPAPPGERAMQHSFLMAQLSRALDLIENAPSFTAPEGMLSVDRAKGSASNVAARMGARLLETRAFEPGLFLSLLDALPMSVCEFVRVHHRTKLMPAGFRQRADDPRHSLGAERPPRALARVLDALHLPLLDILLGDGAPAARRLETRMLRALFRMGRQRMLARHHARERGDKLLLAAMEAPPQSIAAAVAVRAAMRLQNRGHVRRYEAAALAYLERRMVAIMLAGATPPASRTGAVASLRARLAHGPATSGAPPTARLAR